MDGVAHWRQEVDGAPNAASRLVLESNLCCRPYRKSGKRLDSIVRQARQQHCPIMKTHPISFLSGFIAAIAVPVHVNAASLSWSLLRNPTEIAKAKGIVVLPEKTAKSVLKTKMNVDTNGVILKGYDPVAYFTRHQAVKGNPSIQTSLGGAIYHFTSVAHKVVFDQNHSSYFPRNA